jgi:hypothetical protein
MSKPGWFGLAVLSCGAVFGFVSGGAFGLLLASGCLVIGLVLFVANETVGTKRRSTDPETAAPSKTHILVLLKEVHARPLRAGKFQEIREPNQADLQFEIFAHCWLVNDTDQRLGIAGLRVSLAKPGSDAIDLDRVSGDMENWRLGRLRDELDPYGVRYLQAAQECMSELSILEPLEGGATREGWLHLRAQNLTPAEMKNSTIALEVIDSHLNAHAGTAKGPHHLPGRVWPFRPEDKAASGQPSVPTSNDAPGVLIAQIPKSESLATKPGGSVANPA